MTKGERLLDMKHKNRRYVTKHANRRISQRTDLDLTGVNSDDFYYAVYDQGFRLSRFEGDLYDYLLSKRIDGSALDIRVYKDNIFVIDTRQKRIVTVYAVPENLLPVEAYFLSSATPCIIVIKNKDGTREYVAEDGSFVTDIALAMEFRTNQKAMNYRKNNRNIANLIKQGCEVIILDL